MFNINIFNLMKNIFLNLFLFLSLSSLLYADITDLGLHFHHKSDAEYKKMRRKYINFIHSPDTNFNWRIVEQENRRWRQDNINNRFNLPLKKISGDILSGQLADGNITGYWKERGSNNQAGRTHTSDIDFERNYIYTASAGGNIWRKNIGKDNWECLNNNFKINNIVMLKIIKIGNVNRILVACKNAKFVYYSDDECKTWHFSKGLTDKEVTNKRCMRGVINSNGTIYTLFGNTTSSMILKSTDKGESFETIKTINTNVSTIDIWTSVYETTDLYCLVKNTLYRIDNLENSEKISEIALLSQKAIRKIMLSGSKHQNKLTLGVALYRGDSTFFVTSQDEGSTWTDRGKVYEYPFMENSFAVSSVDGNVLYFGGVEFYYNGGGKQWIRQNKWTEYYTIYGGNEVTNLHADIPGINSIIDPAGNEYLLINTDGGTYESRNYLQDITNISLTNLNISQYYSTYTEEADESVIYAGSQDQGLQVSQGTENSIDFKQVISGDYAHICSSDSGNTIWTVYPYMLMNYSDIKTDKTTHMRYKPKNSNNMIWLPPIAPLNNSSQVYMAASDETTGAPQIQKVTNLGSGKSSVQAIITLNEFAKAYNPITALATNPHEENSFYFMTHQGMFHKVIDQEIVFEKALPQTKGHYLSGNKILVSKLNPKRIIIAGSSYYSDGVVVTNDGGQTFESMIQGLPKTTVIDIAQTPDEKYYFAATASGPFVYVVANKRWYEMALPNSPDQTFWSVQYLPQNKIVRFGTYGRGIWDFNIESFKSIENKVSLSGNFTLKALPNPIQLEKKQCKLVFNLPQESSCNIRCYDALGNLIQEDLNLFFNAGENQFTYVLNHNNLSKGCYLIFLQTDYYTNFVKLIID